MKSWSNPPAQGKTKAARWLYRNCALVICLGIPAILAILAILDLLT